jgi:hypothetical protein
MSATDYRIDRAVNRVLEQAVTDGHLRHVYAAPPESVIPLSAFVGKTPSRTQRVGYGGAWGSDSTTVQIWVIVAARRHSESAYDTARNLIPVMEEHLHTHYRLETAGGEVFGELLETAIEDVVLGWGGSIGDNNADYVALRIDATYRVDPPGVATGCP